MILATITLMIKVSIIIVVMVTYKCLGFELLAGALEGLPHGLVILSLANSGMSSRAGSLLSTAMKKNTHFATSLNK